MKDVSDLAERMREMASFGSDQLKRFDKTDRRKMVTEHNENLVINKYLGALEAYGSTS
jgi:hypothetical protein